MSGDPIDAELVDPQPVPAPAPDYDEHGNPTLDHVRDKIETRHAVSIGTNELTDTSSVDQQYAEREQAGRDRLEQIRRSMGR